MQTRRWQSNSFYLVVFVLLSIVATYPLVLNLRYSVVGDLGDPLFVIWVLGWDYHKITSLDLQNFWEGNIFYPAPLTLAYSEHFFGSALLGLPLYLISKNLI